MTKNEWLSVCRENWPHFVALIERFHPSKTRVSPAAMTLDELFANNLEITAPNAELACRVIRKEIVEETAGQPIVAKAVLALQNEEVDTLMSILNQVWFGAPESRSVMAIPGFGTMCDLLSDPPEED